jgi:hypothetical protein
MKRVPWQSCFMMQGWAASNRRISVCHQACFALLEELAAVQREWRRKKEHRTEKRVEAYRGQGMMILAMVMPCSTTCPETREKDLTHTVELWLPHAPQQVSK